MNKVKSTMRARLIAAGCPVDPLDPQFEDRAGGIVIHPRSYYENCIFDISSNGGIGYMLDVALSNSRSRPLTICDFSIELPFDDPQFYWLDDPHECVPEREEYYFSRSLTFPREEVLNHRIFESGRIPGFGGMTGLLLGRSFSSIPASYRHGSEVRAVIHVVDHADFDHTVDYPLYVDRSATLDCGERRKQQSGLCKPGEPNCNKETLPATDRHVTPMAVGQASLAATHEHRPSKGA